MRDSVVVDTLTEQQQVKHLARIILALVLLVIILQALFADFN